MTGIIPWEQPIEYPITLESLQAMSDTELNELSAVEVMGREKSFVFEGQRYNGEYGKEAIQKDWNPTTDMNDDMELLKSYDFWNLRRSNKHYVCEISLTHGIEGTHFVADSLPKAITIASIL